jgi:sialate O-acetylesterase
MHRVLLALGSAWLLTGGAIQSSADITVNRLFSDHMVLQRNATVAVWGTADPGTEMEVTFADSTTSCLADGAGRWTTRISTPEAGGPFELVVSTKLPGGPRIAFSDVLVGEVWLCSGQSNMEWDVKSSSFADREISAAAHYPLIRLCRVERNASVTPLEEVARVVGWDVCSPQTVPEFSAVAYAFAQHYQQATGIPVGLVEAAWGGTSAEAWTDVAALNPVPELAPLMEHWKETEPAAEPNQPGNLFNGMIAPLASFRFAGVLWYQGEANVGRGRQYATLFPVMIANWRDHLADGRELPFYFVQLAPYHYGNHPPEALPELWQAQLETFRKVPHTGMAVITDIGDLADIHPGNKFEVGRRLALWALAGRANAGAPAAGSIPGPNGAAGSGASQESTLAGDPCGPIYKCHEVIGNSLVVQFDFVTGGLTAKDSDELTGFEICGADGQFKPAVARIDGACVQLSSPEVPAPVDVRFGWPEAAGVNLFNGSGLPASPFRSGKFAWLSENVAF